MVSLGDELRREREFREISLRDISEATKINMRILEAIEKNDFKILPGGIFARNFIRAYAEFVGLDPEVAVRKFQDQSSQIVEEKVPPFVVSLARTKNPPTSRQKRQYFFAILALLLLSALLFVWFEKPRRLSLPFFTHRSELKPATSESVHPV